MTGLVRIGIHLITLLAVSLAMGCSSENTLFPPEYRLGKNSYTTTVDGVTREYIVHVPASYVSAKSAPVPPIPMVVMLHGAGGTGEQTHNSSGWKEVGESVGILTVFPTALSYCYTNSAGETRVAPRWHSFNEQVFCPGQTLRDDVAFLRKMISEIASVFHVDPQRVYLVGFSSGGQMTARCAVEMSDLLAAALESGGSAIPDDVDTPLEPIPVAFEFGSVDTRWVGDGNELPMEDFESAMKVDPFLEVISDHVRVFGLEQSYVVSGDVGSALTATFAAVSDPGREFTFTLIKGLDHSYPNTVNHPRYGAEENWKWLQRFSRDQKRRAATQRR